MLISTQLQHSTYTSLLFMLVSSLIQSSRVYCPVDICVLYCCCLAILLHWSRPHTKISMSSPSYERGQEMIWKQESVFKPSVYLPQGRRRTKWHSGWSLWQISLKISWAGSPTTTIYQEEVLQQKINDLQSQVKECIFCSPEYNALSRCLLSALMSATSCSSC